MELAGFICLAMGQQSWIRLLDLGHQLVPSGTTAGLGEGRSPPVDVTPIASLERVTGIEPA